jgi:hypothetical protein
LKYKLIQLLPYFKKGQYSYSTAIQCELCKLGFGLKMVEKIIPSLLYSGYAASSKFLLAPMGVLAPTRDPPLAPPSTLVEKIIPSLLYSG